MFKRILNLLFPTSCSYCRSSIQDSPYSFFCSGCWNDFSVLSGACCTQCGRSFGSIEALTHSPDHTCGMCRKDPPHFDQAVSIGYFEGSLREAIHQYKYRPCRSLGKPLGMWMAGNIRLTEGLDLIMPVPLHKKRLRHRGFNQALLLASPISKQFNIPLCFDNLVRIRPTRPQVELSGEERIKNVRGAFAVKRPDLVGGKIVLLVDDVFTTGATLNECAAVLKKAGATAVNALTLACVN